MLSKFWGCARGARRWLGSFEPSELFLCGPSILPHGFTPIAPCLQAYYHSAASLSPRAYYPMAPGLLPLGPQAYYPLAPGILPHGFTPITPCLQAYYPSAASLLPHGPKPITPWAASLLPLGSRHITPWFHAYYPLRSSLLPLLQHLSQVRRIRIFECRRGQWQRAHGVEQKPLGAARGVCFL